MEVTTQDQVKAYQKFQEHVVRYFRTVYGDDYVYRAPETFHNMLERWMLYAARPTSESGLMAEKQITEIEEQVEASRRM